MNLVRSWGTFEALISGAIVLLVFLLIFFRGQNPKMILEKLDYQIVLDSKILKKEKNTFYELNFAYLKYAQIISYRPIYIFKARYLSQPPWFQKIGFLLHIRICTIPIGYTNVEDHSCLSKGFIFLFFWRYHLAHLQRNTLVGRLTNIVLTKLHILFSNCRRILGKLSQISFHESL